MWNNKYASPNICMLLLILYLLVAMFTGLGPPSRPAISLLPAHVPSGYLTGTIGTSSVTILGTFSAPLASDTTRCLLLIRLMLPPTLSQLLTSLSSVNLAE